MGSQNWGSSHWHGDREALRGPGEVGLNRLCQKADGDRLGRVRKPMWGWGLHVGDQTGYNSKYHKAPATVRASTVLCYIYFFL